ncbi:DinF_Protein [Hexamita inflata]|uniref:DinF_Protein n=1 Tax=Hexamita inflata TaxID=28002 RepID=A0ABP1HC62_9EUKA
MNISLESKQHNASKIYFAYTYVCGLLLSFAICFGLLVGLQLQISDFILWRQQDDEEKVVYYTVIICYSIFYFSYSSKQFLSIEGLRTTNIVLNFLTVIAWLYIAVMTIFFLQIQKMAVTIKSFIAAMTIPVIIGSLTQFCRTFHLFNKKIRYSNVHYIEKSLFKPFRPKIFSQLLLTALYYIYFNLGDALNYFLSFQLVSYEDTSIVSFTIIFLKLSNAINHSVTVNLSAAFRLNTQLKRHDRVFSLFQTVFIVLIINFFYQVLTFSVRNKIFNAVFMGEISPADFFHAALDGIFGTFNAFTTAIIYSEANKTKGVVIGTMKIVFSVGIWMVAKYTNQGNSHFSVMLYFYKYCVDIVGVGYYVLLFAKYYRIRKINKAEEVVFVEQPAKIVLQQMQSMDNISRNTSTDRESKSKELTTSRDIQKSSKQDMIQSWALEDTKENKE